MEASVDRPSTAITHLGGEPAPAELRSLLSPAGAALGGANIVMQLALLPVGHGVAESRVDSGALYKHPIKRARTTFGYVMVALFGSDEEREALGRAVTVVHRQVRNLPGEQVQYSALDPELQLWVAACIYRGIEDVHRLLYGAPSQERLELMYRHSARLATTLQVPGDRWPADRAAFEDYWADTVATIEMDDVTRSYLYDFAGLGFLWFPIPQLLGNYHRAVTAGFLPEPFRQELGLRWGRREQRLFRVTCRGLRAANVILPRRVRALPFDLYLWDMRRRIRNDHNIL